MNSTEHKTVSLEDLDFETKCHMHDVKAKWMISVPCGCHAYICQFCYEVDNSNLESAIFNDNTIDCKICGCRHMDAKLVKFHKL